MTGDSEDEIGYIPHDKSWQMRKTPFPVTQEADYMLSILKERISREIEQCDLGVRFIDLCQWLEKYIYLFGRCFSKEDHHLFIKLCYETVIGKSTLVKPNVDGIKKLLQSLVRKRKILKPGELVLDWKPLFNKWISLLAEHLYSFGLPPVELDSNRFREIAITFRIFFDLDATPAILEEIRRLKCRGATQSPFPYSYVYPYVYQFLPQLVPAGMFDRTVGLWINDVIDEFMEEEDQLTREKLGDIMSTVALFNCGLVDWNRCMARVVTMELSAWNVPFDMFDYDRNIAIPVKFKPPSNHCTYFGRLILYSITPSSNTLDLLEKVFPALSFACDPSVLSVINRAISDFLSDVVYYLQRRLRVERIFSGSYVPWSEPVPAESRLTDALVERLINLLLPLLETMLYGKHYVDHVVSDLGTLANIRPDLVLPRLVRLIDGEFSRLTEPHRVLNALKLTSRMLPSSLGLSAIATEAPNHRTWILDMVPTMLGVISVNDDKKTSSALDFFLSFVKHVPLTACRHSMEGADPLCRRTTELEDFVIDFTETLLNYAKESTSNEAGQSPSTQNFVRRFAGIVHIALKMTPSAVRRRAADKVLSSLINGQFSWATTPDEWAHLMKPFVLMEPEHCLPRVIKVARQLINELEEDYQCAEKETFPNSVPKSDTNEVVAFVSMIFFASPVDLRKHYSVIRGLVFRCLKFRGQHTDTILSYLITQFHHCFEKHRVMFKGPDDVAAVDEIGDTSDKASMPCFVKHWGLTVELKSWTPAFYPQPEEEDYAFRDCLIGELFLKFRATILELTGRETATLSNDEKLELRHAMALLTISVRNLVHARFLCAPCDSTLGRYSDVPEDILSERLLLLKEAPELMIDGQRFWDLLLTMLTTVIDRQIDDFGIWGMFCELVAYVVAGDLGVPFLRYITPNGQMVFEDHKRPTKHAPKSPGYLPKGRRFLSDAIRGMDIYLKNLSAANSQSSALCSRRWYLLQRLVFTPIPTKNAVQFVTILLSRCFSVFPDAADHLLAPLVDYLNRLTDQEIKDLPLVPVGRLVCVARLLHHADALGQVMTEFVRLMARSPEMQPHHALRLPEALKPTETNIYPLEWLDSLSGLQAVSTQLRQSRPCLSRPAPSCDETGEVRAARRIREVQELFETVARLIDDPNFKERLLSPLLGSVKCVFDHNSRCRVTLPRSLGEAMLRYLRDSLNPDVQFTVQTLMEHVVTCESSRMKLEERQVQPEELGHLCAWPGSQENSDWTSSVPVVTCCGLPQRALAWKVPSEPSNPSKSVAMVLFRERFMSEEYMNGVLNTYLQILRTEHQGPDSDFLTSSTIKVAAVAVGPDMLTPALQSRLIDLLGVDSLPELDMVDSVLVGLLAGSTDWTPAEHATMVRWMVPVFEAGLARGRFVPGLFTADRDPTQLLSGLLGDPRRLQPLWCFLFERLERAAPSLDDRETEQLVAIILLLLEGFRPWRVVPLVERLDRFLQPLLANSVPSLRYTALVDRWLRLSVLPSDDTQLCRLFGPRRVEAPSEWLRSLFEADRRTSGNGEMPDWIRRLVYLCPEGEMGREVGFGDLLIEHLDLVLLARGDSSPVNDEATKLTTSYLPGLSLVVLSRGGKQRAVEAILAKLNLILSMEEISDRSLCAALSLWRQLLCRNVVLLPNGVAETVVGHLCRFLSHDSLPVVRAAAQSTSELLRRGVLTPDRLLRCLAANDLPTKAQVHCLSAMMEAFPHRLFPELGQVLEKMKALLKEDGSQRVLIEKAVRNFMRSHQDAWEEKWKPLLRPDSLAALNDLNGSGSYYS